MDIKKFKTKIELHISPVYHNEPPLCKVKFSNSIFYKEELTQNKIYFYEEMLTEGTYNLEISLLNKKNLDTINGKDKAIQIDKIVLNNIESKQFAWQGIYQPIYPEPWANQQKKLGKTLEKFLPYCNYLGWNGTWRLTYSIPIFTWIHKVENHGWIYE